MSKIWKSVNQRNHKEKRKITRVKVDRTSGTPRIMYDTFRHMAYEPCPEEVRTSKSLRLHLKSFGLRFRMHSLERSRCISFECKFPASDHRPSVVVPSSAWSGFNSSSVTLIVSVITCSAAGLSSSGFVSSFDTRHQYLIVLAIRITHRRFRRIFLLCAP